MRSGDLKVLGKDAPAGVAPPDTGTDPGSVGEAADSGGTPAAGAIGGLLAAILVALYLVPVLYTLVSAGTQDRRRAAD